MWVWCFLSCLPLLSAAAPRLTSMRLRVRSGCVNSSVALRGLRVSVRPGKGKAQRWCTSVWQKERERALLTLGGGGGRSRRSGRGGAGRPPRSAALPAAPPPAALDGRAKVHARGVHESDTHSPPPASFLFLPSTNSRAAAAAGVPPTHATHRRRASRGGRRGTSSAASA